VFPTLIGLYDALNRTWRLARSLPTAPLAQFERATAGLPRATEVERLTVQRVGQDIFRAALLDYWGGRCPLTGITDPALLRASHIVPWAECDTDAQRLDVHNGLLLSALWDAAFDAGLVSFADDGTVLTAVALSAAACAALSSSRLSSAAMALTPGHLVNMTRHRSKYGFSPG
jgi:predicted restriction endonuclease